MVVGGGCYGTFYATQLAKAKARAKATYRTVIVVDRDPACRARRELGESPDRRFVNQDWTAFFDEFLARADPGTGDQIVPSPHMPHLMFEWVVRRARARWPGRRIAVDAVPGALGTPYDRTGDDATRYVSFAAWVCPTHCIEPALCPAIGAPRTWEMGDAVRALVDHLRSEGRAVAGPALFVCRHQVFGVGTFAVDAVLAGDRLVAETGGTGGGAGGGEGGGGAVLIGTISACHGALNLLRLGEALEPASVL